MCYFLFIENNLNKINVVTNNNSSQQQVVHFAHIYIQTSFNIIRKLSFRDQRHKIQVVK